MSGISLNPIAGIIEGVGKIAGDLITTEKERRELDLRSQELEQRSDLAQMDINKVEAAHASIFVAGWRPFIGWVCGWSLGLYYIPKALMLTGMWAYAAWKVVYGWDGLGSFPVLPAYPDFGVTDLLGLAGSMLGMSIIRHRETVQGVARGALAPSAAAAKPSSAGASNPSGIPGATGTGEL